ncbi:hypothetical protein MPY17_14040 [Rhodococcus opacus]|uniref:hypothetical protein n=1 Tax=Rhodococcus opacus TaxID=37919 RepID=UPI001FF0E6C4|nr:hypothetical protein [Rhodococcus opacus]UOT06789.1 hypothetical protein MPY17_14040 [Rhodococcus opacus]
MEPIDSAFEVQEVQHVYKVLDPRWMAIRTEHTFRLRALRPHRLFLREYVWDNETGIEKAPTVSSGKNPNGTSSHRLQGPVIVGLNGRRLAVIDLGRMVEPDETETVTIEHFFVRVNPENEGWVSEAVKPGCRRIQLEAILPEREDLRPHWKCQHLGSDNWEFEEPLELHTDDPGRVRVSHLIDNPKPKYRYRVSWDQVRMSE